VRAELSRRHREKVPRSRQATAAIFGSYAREIGKLLTLIHKCLQDYS
jgi:hypothetical protein